MITSNGVEHVHRELAVEVPNVHVQLDGKDNVEVGDRNRCRRHQTAEFNQV